MTIGLLTYGTQIESSKKENGYDSSLEKSEWYALHVRRRFEHVVPFHLKKQNIEHYLLPLRRVTRQSSIRSIEYLIAGLCLLLRSNSRKPFVMDDPWGPKCFRPACGESNCEGTGPCFEEDC
jgi:hypothetical protein